MGWSRRAWLASLPFWSLEAALDKGRQLPSEAKRYADPTTEFAVDRLTDPAHTSVLPACYSHFASHRGTHVLYASDRFGSMQAYRMDVKTGESRQLTEAVALDPASLNLSIDEHNIFYRDGRSIRLLNISNLRERELHQTPSGWEPTPGMSMSIDGVNLLIVESNGGKGRIMLVPVAAKTAGAPSVTTVIETDGVPTEAQPRPKRASVLYSLKGSLWLAHFDGQQNRRLATPAGDSVGSAFWSADGHVVQYLNIPSDPHKLAAIREIAPDTGQDAEVARTTQYLSLSRNGDGSVFLGASRSLASPHVLLLVRSVKRELTLCEHKASDPRMVAPVFSPTSQRIFFVTDRHGKPAIYSMNVEKLVEKTEAVSP